MIAIDGYYPLSSFIRVAKSLILSRLWDYYIAVNEAANEAAADEEWDTIRVERTEYWHENIDIAARFLVHDIIVQAGSGLNRAYVLRADGTRVAVQQKVTTPLAGLKDRDGDYASHRNWRMQDNVVRRGELAFGLDTFKDDFWLEYFTKSQIFYSKEPKLGRIGFAPDMCLPVVNWSLCTIDLSVLRAFAAAEEHLASAKAAIERVGGEPPVSLFRALEKDAAGPLLRLFEPYDGCPIILPEACWKAIEELGPNRKPEERDYTGDTHPTETIMAILDDEGCIGKAAIKERVLAKFPRTSVRQFDRYWQSVADERPELRKPGRKAKSVAALADRRKG
jgi:hypothetical protein